MKRVFTIAILAGTLVGSAFADLIQWGAVSSSVPLHLNGGAAVPSGNVAFVGQFPVGFDFSVNTSLNSLLTNFTRLDSAFVGQDQSGGPALGDGLIFGVEAGTPIGGFNGLTNAPVAPVANQPLYIWVFNGSTPQTSTQWGIVTGSTSEWLFQVGGAGSNNIDIALSSAFVPAGALGSLVFNATDGANELFLGNAVIPEPSTYALGMAGLATLIAFRRRIRK